MNDNPYLVKFAEELEELCNKYGEPNDMLQIFTKCRDYKEALKTIANIQPKSMQAITMQDMARYALKKHGDLR